MAQTSDPNKKWYFKTTNAWSLYDNTQQQQFDTNFNATILKFDVTIGGNAYDIDLTGAPSKWKQTSKIDAKKSRRILHELPANIINHHTRASVRPKTTPSFTLNVSPFTTNPTAPASSNAAPPPNAASPNSDLMLKIKAVFEHKLDNAYDISVGDASIIAVTCVMCAMLHHVPLIAVTMAIVIWFVYTRQSLS